MNRELLKQQLGVDEGLRLKPYRDTVGKLTIGIGRNLDDVGISEREAYFLLDTDIDAAETMLDRSLPWWRSMNDARQNAILNCAFNLGITRLLGFKNALAAMQRGEFDVAAAEMLDSTWAQQVGARAERLAAMMRTGKFA